MIEVVRSKYPEIELEEVCAQPDRRYYGQAAKPAEGREKHEDPDRILLRNG